MYSLEAHGIFPSSYVGKACLLQWKAMDFFFSRQKTEWTMKFLSHKNTVSVAVKSLSNRRRYESSKKKIWKTVSLVKYFVIIREFPILHFSSSFCYSSCLDYFVSVRFSHPMHFGCLFNHTFVQFEFNDFFVNSLFWKCVLLNGLRCMSLASTINRIYSCKKCLNPSVGIKTPEDMNWLLLWWYGSLFVNVLKYILKRYQCHSLIHVHQLGVKHRLDIITNQWFIVTSTLSI